MGVDLGGHYTVNDLLHGLLMHSGNDAAPRWRWRSGAPEKGRQRPGKTDGRRDAEDQHARHETRRATRVAPCRAWTAGDGTSAYDMGLFCRYAYNNPTFANIVATRTYNFPGHPAKPGETSDHPAYELENDNKLLLNYRARWAARDRVHRRCPADLRRRGKPRRPAGWRSLLRGTREPIAPWGAGRTSPRLRVRHQARHQDRQPDQ